MIQLPMCRFLHRFNEFLRCWSWVIGIHQSIGHSVSAGEELFLFTREYFTVCYEMCKAGVPIYSILYGRKKNTAFMNLSKYPNFKMPYFVEYYDLAVA